MSYYKFRQCLKYKCIMNGIEYRKVKEKYTSKMCSVCGTYNENLGGNKKYICTNNACKKKLGRDDTSARNIFMLEAL